MGKSARKNNVINRNWFPLEIEKLKNNESQTMFKMYNFLS
jgi:hypothetical protein